MSIIDLLPSKEDYELKIMRSNTLKVFNESDDPKRQSKADELILAIDEEFVRRSIPGMIETFKERYDGGFYSDIYLEEERNYKLKASKVCLELFAKEDFEVLISDSDWGELFDRVKKVVNLTNLMQPSFEKPQLFDGIRKDGVPDLFYPSLYDCIHSNDLPAQRLGRFSKMLVKINLDKWTYASYFLFLSDPENCMFVKPQGMKKSLEKTNYALEYDAHQVG